VIQALTFPAVFFHITNRVVVDKYPHLLSLDLADEISDECSSKTVDVLIGSDFYWSIVIGNIIHGNSGPAALNSHFEWLVSVVDYGKHCVNFDY